jgi:DNA-binding NarL/FixJ family response regulator
MDQVMSDRPRDNEGLERIVSALQNGFILVDPDGRILWMDEAARRRIDGGLQDLVLPVLKSAAPSIDCFLSVAEVTIDGKPTAVCVAQETVDKKESGHDIIAAIEAVMADTSWFTRAIVDKLKAWRQATQPATRSSDLELLTDREREILGLICEGRSDAEMSRMLNLSQNTVRNHVASLYRKIGVNRRSAAIIWARERAITIQEVLASRGTKRSRRQQPER